jgi:ATP-dependent protease ClpP protease subunit
MTADQAKEFGLIDKVLNQRDDVDPKLVEGKPA